VSTSFEVRPWRHASASQITTWRSCHLKWWWQTIGGFRAETTKAQQQGQEIHAQIETYLKGGPVPENPIAVSGLIHLPSPHEINVEGVEYGFALESSDAPVPIVGFIDLLDSPRRRIIDHKTTSDFKYMKTPDVLMQDPQAVIYCAVGVEPKIKGGFQLGEETLKRVDFSWTGPVEFKHVYYRTRGAPASATTSIFFQNRLALEERVNTVFEDLWSMSFEAKQRPEDVPPTLTACGEYGGCPHKARCASIGHKTMGLFSGLVQVGEKKEENMGINPLALAKVKLQQKPEDSLAKLQEISKRYTASYDAGDVDAFESVVNELDAALKSAAVLDADTREVYSGMVVDGREAVANYKASLAETKTPDVNPSEVYVDSPPPAEKPTTIIPSPVVEAQPKRKPGRPKKVQTEAAAVEAQPKRKPGRPKKVQTEAAAVEAQPKRKPGRPKKVQTETAAVEAITPVAPVAPVEAVEAQPKRKPGRPKKVQTEAAAVEAQPKRKPGRPKKVQTEAAAVEAITPVAPVAPVEAVEAQPKRKSVLTSGSSLIDTLYVDCLPQKAAAVDAGEVLRPYLLLAAQEIGVAHYLLADYRMGARGAVALLVGAVNKGELTLPKYVYIASTDPVFNEAFAYLRSVSNDVVRPCR
jgi:hypothetical protein